MGYYADQIQILEDARQDFTLGHPSSWQTVGGRDYVLRRWVGGRLFELRRDTPDWGLYEVAGLDVPPNTPDAKFIEVCVSITIALLRINEFVSLST